MNIIELLKNNTNIDLLRRLKTNVYMDGTYDLQTMKPIQFNNGYQATFQTTSDNYTKKEFWNLVNWYSKITDGKYYIGKYNNELEVSFHFDIEQDAKDICKKFNQISYWDWQHMDEIKNKYYKIGIGNDY